MSLLRWDPFEELEELRESMDRLFEDFFGRRPLRRVRADRWQPAIDMYETDREVVVRAELPGIDPKDVDISISGNVLSLKGESKLEREVNEKDYYRRELRYGAFSRSITLPVDVKAEGAKATFRHGILEVRIPKAEEALPKTIKIEVKE